jgi:nitrogen regulatory protein PII
MKSDIGGTLNPNPNLVPDFLAKQAKHVSFADNPIVLEIIAEHYTQQRSSHENMLNLLERFEQHMAALEQQLYTALNLEPNQVMQYGESEAVILEGIPLENEAYTAAQVISKKRHTLKLLAALTQNVQIEIFVQSERVKPHLEAIQKQHDTKDIAIIGTFAVPFDNIPTGSVKA